MHAESVSTRECNWLDKGAAADRATQLTPEDAFLHIPHVRRIRAEALASVHPLLDGSIDTSVYRRIGGTPGKSFGGKTGGKLLLWGRFVGDCLRHVLFQRLVKSTRLLRFPRLTAGANKLRPTELS